MVAIALRPERDSDRDFVGALRRADAAPPRRPPFAPQQPAQAPAGLVEIVVVNGQSAGCLCTYTDAEALHLIDVNLLPAWRGRGIGTALLMSLRAQAARQGLPLRLSVALDNPVMRLCRRFGFAILTADTQYAALEWRAATRPD